MARIQVGDWYAAGWDNAAAMTVWPPRAETGEEVLTFDVSAPMYYEKTPGTWVREKVTRTFTLTEGTPGPSGFIGVSDGTNVVARIDVSDWYSTGYTDGYAAAGTTDISNARARFNSAPNQYYIEAFNVNNNNPVANSALYYQLGRSGNKIQIQNTSGTKYGSTQEYTLTEHSNCAQGLHRAMVSGNPIHDKLYYKDGSVYKEVTGSAQYWYYKDSNQSLTTYYT